MPQDAIILTFICQREGASGGEQRVVDDAWDHRFSYERQRGCCNSAAALSVPHRAHAQPGRCHQRQLQMLPIWSLSPPLSFPFQLSMFTACAGHDLNRRWLKPDPVLHPEIVALKVLLALAFCDLLHAYGTILAAALALSFRFDR